MAGRQYQNVSYGLNQPLNLENPTPIIAKRNPTTSDFALLTTIWTNTTNNAVFILASVANNTANWVAATGGAGVFTSLTVTPGPISLTGTTMINTAGGATTTIGTGGTGPVQIGNATGNTSVTGSLTTTTSLNAGTSITSTNGAISAGNTVVGTNPAIFQALKSRGGGVITTGDGLGQMLFAGFDGTQYTVGAAITSASSGTIANTRVAGNLNFFTHPDAAVGGPTSRMTINSAGNVVINNPDSGVGLTVAGGGATVTAGNITATAGNVILSNAAAAFVLGNGIQIVAGTGDPNGAVTAPEGSLYLNTNGTGTANRAYINTNSGTVWTAITTAS